MELRCPLCRSERIVVVLRTQLILCRQCGWRWLEDQEWRELGLADVTGADSLRPQPTPPRRAQ
ncbi:MAG: hypothetical protein E6G40_09305 [Actinobacteria bacterium]|nr:MAG: hypothetical protein E6G40_09305 [Actinomycetota bacterium]